MCHLGDAVLLGIGVDMIVLHIRNVEIKHYKSLKGAEQ